MKRSLAAMAACSISAAAIVGVGSGVAAADTSAHRHPRPAPTKVSKLDPNSDTDDAQLSHLRHLAKDQNGRKQLWDYLRSTI